MANKRVVKTNQLHISVRDLVEFIFREGDIDNRSVRIASAETMLEGSKIHRKIQKSMGGDYRPEVLLRYYCEEEQYSLTVEGRADGIFTEDDTVYIDEIKGMYRDVERFEDAIFVHKAQAMCYAYMHAMDEGLAAIGVQLTYCNLDTEQLKYFRYIFAFEEIEEWFFDLLSQYKKWADFQFEWRKLRQESIKKLQFPFEYREGQKKLVEDVYRTILREKNLFLQASTGVGKTISTIFPAVKAVGEELADRIFYLTAKTITASVAKQTFELLREQGYKAKVIQLTAKEKLCMCEEMDCNPINCPYAKGHFDRVNDAVFDLLQKSDLFTREEILAQAEEFYVCPFEMSLDVATWADAIICDYNYAYDPNVYLKRFFQEGVKGDYIFLVDEAHNLVDRSREMHSAVLCKEDFLKIKKIVKPYNKLLERDLDKCNKILLAYKKECETYQVLQSLSNLHYPLMRLYAHLETYLQNPKGVPERKELLEFYFTVKRFLNTYSLLDDNYVIYSKMDDDGFYVKLLCVDPSENLQKCINKGVATIFFSATLLPIQYYKSLLSTDSDNYAVYAASTFSADQRKLLIAKDVSTKYTRRNRAEFEKMVSYIEDMVSAKVGNYMVFFPSYKLMRDVFEIYEEMHGEKRDLLIQGNSMKETEREEFLFEFAKERDKSLVAFCVMGGIFGEGIDLKNDQLIGAAIVGTGLPQVGDEREILRNFYEEKNGNGFDYAYRFPGINKVLQAAGRVIRTNEDEGIILLMDERFLQSDYEYLFPREWNERTVCSLETVENEIKEFWAKK